MSKGIWISPKKFIEFGEKDLLGEVASREAAWDFDGLIGLLPDPDPVLAKRGDTAEILEGLTADAHLISVIQTRKLGSLKREFKWEPGTEKGKTTPASEQLCARFTDDLEGINLYDLLSALLDAPYYGMIPLEIIWQPGKNGLRIVDLRALPSRWFGFNDQNEPRFLSRDNMWEGEELPWGKFVFTRHFPTYDNPYGLRLLSRCFWPVLFKRGGIKFWVTFTEKFGMPFVLGRYAKGTKKEDQQDFLNKLKKMVSDAVAVVPDGSGVEMLGGGGGNKTNGSSDLYQRLKEAMDGEISKVIMGQTLTAEVGDRGSYAASKTHENVLDLYQESDQKLVKSSLEEVAAIYTKVNAPGVPAPVFKWFESEDPQGEFAERDEKLARSGQVKFSKSYFVRRYGFQEDDIEIMEERESEKTETPEQPADHAELQADPGPGFAVEMARQAQNRLDQLAGRKIAEGALILKGSVNRIKEWLNRQPDMDAALTDITGLFDILADPDAPLAGSLFEALFKADELGRDSEEFAEAQWGTGKPFQEAVDYFRARSFSIAGVTSEDLVAVVRNELVRQMEEGRSINEFRANMDDIFLKHGYDPLRPWHVDTIYRTNMQTAFQAGRFQQMTKPHLLRSRPWWQYVAVDDLSTRPTHAAMDNRIFHHTNPVWKIWYPPNGFNCRCQVVSLSDRELGRDKLIPEDQDPTGSVVEQLNKVTGEIKKIPLQPDEGWGAAGGTLEKLYRHQKEMGGGKQTWWERKQQPGPLELGRPKRADIPDYAWIPATQGPSIEDLAQAQGLNESEALAIIEAEYRRIMGISPLETHAVVRARDGAPITVTLQSLAHAMIKREDGRERYLPYMRSTLEEPFEILLTEYENAQGRIKSRKKYIGLFQAPQAVGVVIPADLN